MPAGTRVALRSDRDDAVRDEMCSVGGDIAAAPGGWDVTRP